MKISTWAHRSTLAAGLMLGANSAQAATTYDLMVNHDAFQVVANGSPGVIGSGSVVVDGPVGGNFVYRAKPKINAGSGSVSAAVLVQKLPVGAIFQSVTTPAGVSCNPTFGAGHVITASDGISCTISTLTEAEQHIDFQVILPSSGTDHKASASISAPDNTDNNRDNDVNIERNITTYERADLAVTFTSPTPSSEHQQGEVVNYQIQVSNTNSEYAYPLNAGEKAVARFLLPSGTAFSGSPSSPGNVWACTDETDTTATPALAYKECTYTAGVSGVGKDTNLPLLTIPVVVEAASGSSTALVSVEGQNAGNVTFVDAYPDNNSTDVSITFAPNNQLDMKLVKSVSPSVVDAKATSPEVIYTLTATRNSGGMIPALPITITDTLPANVIYVSGSSTGSGWSCSAVGQTVTCTATADAILADGNLNVLTFKANVAASSVVLVDEQAVIENEAKLNVANEPTANKENNNTSKANLTVSNRADLTVNKSVSQSVIAQGQEFSYTIGVKNNGPLDVTLGQTITITDILDGQLEYVPSAADETPWTCAALPLTWTSTTPQTLTCTLAAGIAAGASADLKFNVKAHLKSGQFATIDNEASVACPVGRHCVGWTGGNSLTNKPEINISDLVTDLSITKGAEITPDSSDYGTDASGVEVVYTLKVKNAVPVGGVPTNFQMAQTVVVEDTIENLLSNNLPSDYDASTKPYDHPITGTPRYANGRFVIAEVKNVPTGENIPNCTYTSTGTHSTTVRCELKNVPVGADEYEITIKARQFVNPTTSGETNTIKNVTTVSSPDTAEFDTANNTADDSVELAALANMKAQKQASVANAAAGQKIDYTLTATNHGPSQARNVQIKDTLPLGMIWVSAPSYSQTSGAGTCTLANGATIASGLVITAANQVMTCTWTSAFNGGFNASGNALTTRDVKYALRSPNEGYASEATNYAEVDTSTPETIPLTANDTDNKTSKKVSFNQPKLNVLINMGHTADGLPTSQILGTSGSQTQYTITVTNSADSTSFATNVTMFNQFPAAGSTAVFGGAALDSVALTGGGANRFDLSDCTFVTTPANGLQCNFDWLAPGESVDIKFTLQALEINNGGIPVGTIRHTARVSADGEYLGAGFDVEKDNTVTDRTSAYAAGLVDPSDLEKYVDLSVSKEIVSTSSTEPLKVGDEMTYRITVKNGSIYPQAETATVTDSLPKGLELVGSAPTNCVYDSNTRTLMCTIAATPGLAVGASTSFEFTTKVVSLTPGQKAIENTATLNNPKDPDPSNNQGKTTKPSDPPPVSAVPVDNPLALLAMILGMGWIARRFHMRKQA